MHNNMPYFKDTKCTAGFFRILDPQDPDPPLEVKEPAALQAAGPGPGPDPVHLEQQVLKELSTIATAGDSLAKKAEDARTKYNEMHNLSDGDLYSLAAFVATLMLRCRMQDEGVQAAAPPLPLPDMANQFNFKTKIDNDGNSHQHL
jgi:hypothetical protein